MKHVRNLHEILREGIHEGKRRLSPLELIKKTGGVAHPVRTPSGKAVDSMLAVYRDRFTYTFILNKEVASIHFDKNRHEVFFKGHNVAGLTLTTEQIKALKGIQTILSEDEQGRLLFNDYVATLTHVLADKYK